MDLLGWGGAVVVCSTGMQEVHIPPSHGSGGGVQGVPNSLSNFFYLERHDCEIGKQDYRLNCLLPYLPLGITLLVNGTP